MIDRTSFTDFYNKCTIKTYSIANSYLSFYLINKVAISK